MAIKSRAELKSYFIKNAIPTAGNFADLIESSLNTGDDGVSRLPGQPLRLAAFDEGQRRVLALHSSATEANPDWLISLPPSTDQTLTQPGFRISDGSNVVRFFIASDGKVGLGTDAPRSRLDVIGDMTVAGKVNGRDLSADARHFTARDNPHQTTAAQVGALASAGGQISGNLTVSGQGVFGQGGVILGLPTETGGGAQRSPNVRVCRNEEHDVSVLVTSALTNDVAISTTKTSLVIAPSVPGYTGLKVYRTPEDSPGSRVPTAEFSGHVTFETAHFTGDVQFDRAIDGGASKGGYVTDTFFNGSNVTLRTGDIVKLKPGRIAFRGEHSAIPIAEVTLADTRSDPLVMGIVGYEATPASDEFDERTNADDPTSIEPGGRLFVITLGSFAHCKVDATQMPIEVGDLLTSSSNPGHAEKAQDPKVGTIIGKALEPLQGTTGHISVFVNIQ